MPKFEITVRFVVEDEDDGGAERALQSALENLICEGSVIKAFEIDSNFLTLDSKE